MRRVIRRSTRQRSAAGGFTLIESAMATVIVGVGVLAMVDAQSAFMRSNLWSSHAASGTYLANEIREMTRHLPRHDPVSGLVLDSGTLHGWGPDAGEIVVSDFDDLDDFDGLTFAATGTAGWGDGDLPGPIDAFGTVIEEINLSGTELGSAMGGWSQVVTVQKIDPFNTAYVAPDDSTGLASFIPVDEFPLRVTVDVFFQNATDPAPVHINGVSWIVPGR